MATKTPAKKTTKKVVYTDVMIDLETLGTAADSVILSIGACRFNLATGEVDDAGFYICVDVDDQLARGRRIQGDTLQWWLSQDAAAKKALFVDLAWLDEAVQGLIDWFGLDDKLQVWSNGASFDIPMLEHAMRTLKMSSPWKFWNARCMRTYKTLPGADAVTRKFEGTKHHALIDAVNQAHQVSAIHQHLFGAK